MCKHIKNVFASMVLCLSLEAKDFVINCDKCVIGVGSTNEEIEKFKEEKGEDDFYDAADDANYYGYVLREYLEANGIEYKYISRLDTYYTKLVFPNESIDIARLDWIYEYYLYQKDKKPEKLKYVSDPQEQVNIYFNIINPKH